MRPVKPQAVKFPFLQAFSDYPARSQDSRFAIQTGDDDQDYD
jgi:hypothetical protein